jgi:hypothetical protein
MRFLVVMRSMVEGRMLMTLSKRPYPNRHHARNEDLPSPPHLRREGHRSGSHPVLQAIQIDQAILATLNTRT